MPAVTYEIHIPLPPMSSPELPSIPDTPGRSLDPEALKTPGAPPSGIEQPAESKVLWRAVG